MESLRERVPGIGVQLDHRILAGPIRLAAKRTPPLRPLLAGSRGRLCPIMCWLDNQGALYCALNGRSADPDMSRLVFLAQLRIAQLRARVWFDYVPSASNVADLPTRLDDAAFARLMRLGCLCLCGLRPSGACRVRGLS